MTEEHTGRKDDEGKPDYSLIPYETLDVVVRVLMHGAAKYDRDNWRHVAAPKRRYFAAAMRHVLAWWRGEKLDAESGLHHLAHAICCLMFLVSLETDPPATAAPEEPR